MRGGFLRGVENRPLMFEEIEKWIIAINHQLRATGGRELPSYDVGSYVMEALKAMDQVAYVRFASVYRSFQDLSEFRDAIESLEAEPPAET